MIPGCKRRSIRIAFVSTGREAMRLHDIVANIERIEGEIAGLNFAGFAAAMMIVDAVER